VGTYVLDFYCLQERLAIGLDGQGHFNTASLKQDAERDAY